MSKVFLREYNHEIERMIEGGQLDEAIAHCQHILKTFPMHVETYRLLGKAFLEARRYGDAADIFQRALMAVPDDFVSHVGMSIIRDDEGKLDESIWHMERAFEIQPSNSAIQGELRRLYGRRDGVEPTKIRLTRDALANMYSQGELYNQAIAEIRSVLADDPNRPDLQVMLARAYFRSGQKVEAAEMAAALLKKYPYCVDALRVLVEVIPESSGSTNTQVYKQRLHMLDPYSSFTMGSVFASDHVADSAVSLEKLDYKTGPLKARSQPDWASSLGIRLTEEKKKDTPPEWIRTSAETEETQIEEQETVNEEKTGQSDEESEMPDWMRSAGWYEASSSESNPSEEPAEEEQEASIAKADIPDWLKSMAPSDADDAENNGEENNESISPLPVGDDGIPEWLKSQAPKANAPTVEEGEPEQPDESQSLYGEEIPEWFKSISPSEQTSDEAAEKIKDQPESQGPSADFVSEPETKMEESIGEEDIPDWLKSMTPVADESLPSDQPAEVTEVNYELEQEEESSSENTPSVPIDENESVQPEAVEEIPDWLESAREEAEPADTVQVPATNEGATPILPVTPASEEGELPDWLQSMRSSDDEAAENFEELVKTPQVEGIEGDEGLPDWLNQEPEEPSGGNIKQPEVSEANDEAMPDWIRAEEPEENQVAPIDGSESIDEKLQKDLQMLEETPPVKLPEKDENFPEWLTDMGARATAAGITASLASENEERETEEETAISDQPSGMEINQLEGESEEQYENIPSSLDESIPTPENPSTPANEQMELEDEEIQSQPTGNAKPLEIGDDALGWLESLAAKQGAKPEELLTTPEERNDQIPDWLRMSDDSNEQPPAFEETSTPEESKQNPSETMELGPLEWLNEQPSSDISETIEEKPISALKNDEQPEEVGIPAEKAEEERKTWLEELSSDQMLGTGESKPIPEEQTNEPLDWLSEVMGETHSPTETVDNKLIPPERPADDITITSWLSKKDVEDSVSENTEGEAADETVPLDEDLPNWLKDLEKPVTPTEIPEPEEELPEWLREPSLPVSSEKTEETEHSATEPVVPGDEQPPEVNEPAPTSTDDWVPVEIEETRESLHDEEHTTSEVTTEIVPEQVNIEDEPEVTPEVLPDEKPPVHTHPQANAGQIPGKLPTLKQTGMLSHIPAQDKDSELLSDAQTILDDNSLDESMKKYGKLIKKGKLLDEVIHDLREAIYRYPVDVVVWQTLGDAYMRANRLQDALDSYTKAEELLR